MDGRMKRQTYGETKNTPLLAEFFVQRKIQKYHDEIGISLLMHGQTFLKIKRINLRIILAEEMRP
jgi:hypothetical protein